jgi:hypothetical protein
MPPKKSNAALWPSQNASVVSPGYALDEAGVAVRQDEGKEVSLALDPSDRNQGFAEIRLGMPGRMHERDEHLLRAQPALMDVVLHDGVAACEAVLVPQPLEYPLRRVPLLYRPPFVIFKDPVDHTRERVEHWTGRRTYPPVPGWDRERQHLADRVPVQSE